MFHEYFLIYIFDRYNLVIQCRKKRATVNATDCGFDTHSRKLNIQYVNFFALVTRQSARISPEFGGTWGLKCFNGNEVS